MIGQKFGRLTVVASAGKGKSGHPKVWVECDCGEINICRTAHIKKGFTKSCGCLNRENKYKHGQCGTRLYLIWRHMKDRCNNKNDANFKYYGAKGVVIYECWNDFRVFSNWANVNGYKSNLEIDRIDNLGNYEPTNCRFTDHKTNSQNSRRSRRWYVGGKWFGSLSDAATFFKVHSETIRTWCGRRPDKLAKSGCYSITKY